MVFQELVVGLWFPVTPTYKGYPSPEKNTCPNIRGLRENGVNPLLAWVSDASRKSTETPYPHWCNGKKHESQVSKTCVLWQKAGCNHRGQLLKSRKRVMCEYVQLLVAKQSPCLPVDFCIPSDARRSKRESDRSPYKYTYISG